MSLYAAIDLHSTNSVLAVIDEADQPLRQRRLPNELPAILEELEPYRDELAGIVVESTYNWYWLVDEKTGSECLSGSIREIRHSDPVITRKRYCKHDLLEAIRE